MLAPRNCFRDQLKAMKQEGIDNIGVTPCVFSEIGIPYDMDDKYAYKTGDYISQIRAMDANHYALEGAQVGFTLWTYCVSVSLPFRALFFERPSYPRAEFPRMG